MLKIGIASYWHVHAPDYAKIVKEHENCGIFAVWDENPERGGARALELECPYYEDYGDFLRSDIDAVIVCGPTDMHPELITRAANAKKHIFTEKVLSIGYDDARNIEKAITGNGVKFAISFPYLCAPEWIAAAEMARSGRLGTITYARVRNVHNGSIAGWLPSHFYRRDQCGGGAMIDLGAHPMYLLPCLLGEPKRVQSVFLSVTGRGVEDNAVSVIEFENGVIGVSETGFVSVYNPFTLEISGTKGCLLWRNGLFYADEQTRGEWVLAQLPKGQNPPLVQWIDSIGGGDVPEQFGIARAVKLTKLMEAAYMAQRSGSQIEV